jgi:hypothetical protein
MRLKAGANGRDFMSEYARYCAKAEVRGKVLVSRLNQLGLHRWGFVRRAKRNVIAL